MWLRKNANEKVAHFEQKNMKYEQNTQKNISDNTNCQKSDEKV